MNDSKLTLADFPDGVTLFALYRRCGRDEEMVWERYWRGDFAPDLQQAFENNCIPAVTKSLIYAFRGYMRAQTVRPADAERSSQ